MIPWFLAILSLISLILYPILIFLGLKFFNIKIVGVGASILLASRLGFFKGQSLLGFYVLIALIISLILNLLGVLFQLNTLYKFYPIIINFSLLTAFAHSLRGPQSIVEQFARIQKSKLSDQEIRYTRNVTKIWIIFFGVNGSIATYTAIFRTTEEWAFYNGFFSYILCGLLFCGEKIFRSYYLRKNLSL
jgi:uncharacterized membrane protein